MHYNDDSEREEKLNPEYLFSQTLNDLLAKIVKGEVDPHLYAKKELASRGYDENVNWIGFRQAKEHFGLTDRN